MARQVQTIGNNVSGVTQYSNAIIPDLRSFPYVGIQVQVTGTATWTVEVTLDNLFDPTITPLWFPHSDANLVGQTVSRQGNIAFPVGGIHIALATGSTGTVKLTTTQAGPVV